LAPPKRGAYEIKPATLVSARKKDSKIKSITFKSNLISPAL
jgi:hypothetical protein